MILKVSTATETVQAVTHFR